MLYRSCGLDEWTMDQLQIMKLSGNSNCREFFKKHGVPESQMTVSLYISSFNSNKLCLCYPSFYIGIPI